MYVKNTTKQLLKAMLIFFNVYRFEEKKDYIFIFTFTFINYNNNKKYNITIANVNLISHICHFIPWARYNDIILYYIIQFI